MTALAAVSADEWGDVLGENGIVGPLRESLTTYLQALSRFGGVVDLVGRLSPRQIVGEHVVGALRAVPFVPQSGRLVDVGSGAGLPAIPLLLARPALEGVLLEPRERRWAFLREAVREVGVRAVVERASVAAFRGGPFEVMTCRGVAARVWVGEVPRLLRYGGVVVWWAGARARVGVETPEGFAPVLPSPSGGENAGDMVVWRRCST